MYETFFLIFSDQRLEELNFTRSKSLPDPYPYSFADANPILLILADQIPGQEDVITKMVAIFNGIITGLQNGLFAWPGNPNLLPKEDWIEKMLTNRNFYRLAAKNAEEFQNYDYQMIQIASNCLNSQIDAVSFLTGETKTFLPASGKLSGICFNILSCNSIFFDSFNVSIFKK